jgi:ring-1,2-phenylacetyl-CoA epoxidase subunit PaaD
MVKSPFGGNPPSMRQRLAVWALLDEVKDPEVPALSVVELGIVRDVEIDHGNVTITVTPTYSGCPAMQTIEDDIRSTLTANGIANVRIKTVYAPAWTTDWMSDAAKEKLRAYGIAPPGHLAQDEPIAIMRKREAVPCPFCGSADTRHTSEFGSTSCKALHVCNACTQPFEEFKAH